MSTGEVAHPAGQREVLGSWSPLIVLFLALTALSTVSLYLLTERTDRFFAWTIRPPLSAAFLGGGYAAGFVLVVLTARERTWGAARITYATVCVFTWATLGATLPHLDRFHFGVAEPWPRFLAWLWLVVYVTVPPWMTALLVAQRRVPGTDGGIVSGLPRPLVVALGAQAALLSAVGVALLVAPTRLAAAWPWMLTPLTGRTIGAWCLALGFAAGLALWVGDLGHLRVAAVTYVTFGLLQGVALARFKGDVSWDHASAWVYASVVVAITATGLYGLLAGRGGQRRAA